MDSLTVTGKLESITAITDYVLRAAEAADLNEKTAYYLSLAVDEITTNIILHGYEEAGLTGDLTITAVMQPHTLKIILEDSGLSYDPRQVASPDLERPLHEREPGGLGIYLALRSVDKFHYCQHQGHNRSTFIIQKQKQS